MVRRGHRARNQMVRGSGVENRRGGMRAAVHVQTFPALALRCEGNNVRHREEKAHRLRCSGREQGAGQLRAHAVRHADDESRGGAFFQRLEKALRPELTREGGTDVADLPSAGAAPGGIRAAGRWKAWAAALAAGVALGAAGLHVAGFFGTPEDGRLEAQRKTPEFAALEKKALAGDASAQCDLGLTLLRGEAFRRIRPRAWNGLPERQGRAMPKRRTILAKCTVWGRACPRTTARRRICLPRPPRRAMRKRSAASASCTATERAFRRIRAG